MKKFLAVLLSIIMVLSVPVMGPLPAEAADTVVFSFGNATVTPGANFDLTVNVTSNPTGFGYVGLVNVKTNLYTKYGLTINSVTPGPLLSSNATITGLTGFSKYANINIDNGGTITGTGVLLTINVTAPTEERTLNVSLANILNVVYSGSLGSTALNRQFTDGEIVITRSASTQTNYTVSYDANGGTGAPAAQKKKVGTPLTLSYTTPTRDGYVFQGWAPSNSATTAQYTPGGTYNVDANMTLYAVWKRNSYVITYNANGGVNAPSTTIKNHGQDVRISTTEPTREGYSFAGWGTTPTDTTANYQANALYKTDADITLYAIWVELPTYTIKYDANGGQGVPASQKKTLNIPLDLRTSVPTRAYHTFLGWATSPNATQPAFQPGDKLNFNGDLTLYAVWEGYPYKVVYRANGGTGTMENQNFVYGTAQNLTKMAYTREGYDFMGWAVSSVDNTVVYNDEQQVINLTTTKNGTVYLYAVWRASFTVTYNVNGGTSSVASQRKVYGEDLKLRTTIPTREGYTFRGWGTSSKGRAAVYQPGDMYTENSGITLFAMWSNDLYPYEDVMASASYAKDVYYVYDQKAMTGKTATTFQPDAFLTRSQLAALLYKLEGSPYISVTKKPYSDTPLSGGTTKAIAWAKKVGVVSGYKDGTYRPSYNVTRQHFAQILYNYSKMKGIDVSVDNPTAYKACTDASEVSNTFVKAVNWAYENGLIGSGGTLNPNGNAKRYEVASIIARYLKKFAQ